jgi:RNA polymerase sigma-70 factor (ECF subfamily)
MRTVMNAPVSTVDASIAGATTAPQTLVELFDRHRERLRIVVELRMDPRLRARVDASDVLQETYLDAAARWSEQASSESLGSYFWLRFLAVQRLLILHRRHLSTHSRDARREVPLPPEAALEVSSCSLAGAMLDAGTSPSHALTRAEAQSQLHATLSRLDAFDREVLALRHFEQLSNAEAATVLGITAAAASQRYYRALKRLRELLGAAPGGAHPSGSSGRPNRPSPLEKGDAAP